MKVFKKKNILIVGGTGSFGSTLLHKLLASEANEIKIFSRDEQKQEFLRRKVLDKRVSFIIGDIRDQGSLKSATKKINYIFHAAALKQVPTCEFFPEEAVKTNIIGTKNLLDSAVKNGVEKIVLLSTDKAVYPVNAMGLSKALMEKVAIAEARNLFLNKSNTKILITRYGNVMASRGSLIPFVVEQILLKKNLTITDPEMTRFLMSLDETVSLVFKAFEVGSQGDIFVQKAPAAKILNIFLALKKIFKSKSKIKVIGPRHGEKMHETLVGSEEMSRVKSLGKFYKISADLRNINYDVHLFKNKVNLKLDEYNSSNTNQLNIDDLVELFLEQSFIRKKLKNL